MGQGAGSVPAAQPVCNVYVCICVNAHVSMYAYVRACVHFSVCVSVCVCAHKSMQAFVSRLHSPTRRHLLTLSA